MRRLSPLALAAVAACATSTSNMTDATPQQLPGYTQSYDLVFDASMTAATMLGWEFTAVEKEVGLIAARAPVRGLSNEQNITIRIFRPEADDSLIRVGMTSNAERALDLASNGRAKLRHFYEKLDRLLASAK